MKKSIFTILQYVFFLGLGIFFVWLSVRKINHAEWVQIKHSLQQAKLWLIVPAVIALLLSHYSRAMRWKILMEPMGYKPSNFNTFAAVMIGYLVNAGVPRLGEVVKCTLLSRYEKVRADRLVGTIVMERAVDVVCLTIAFIAALIFQGDVIGHYVSTTLGGAFRDKTGHTSAQKIAITVGAIIVFILLVHFLLKRFGHIDFVGKIKNVLQGIAHGLQSIRFVKHKGLFLFHTILIWSMYLAATTIGILALQETKHLGVGGGLTTLAVGSVGMILTPGGIGAYPLLVSGLMELYGLKKETIGTALGWLLWSVQTLIIIGGGLIVSILFSYFNKNKKPVESRGKLTDEDFEPI